MKKRMVGMAALSVLALCSLVPSQQGSGGVTSDPASSSYRRRWAVVVGVDDYVGDPALPALKHAQNDARGFRDIIVEEFGYADGDVRLLTGNVGYKTIIQALEDAKAATKIGADDAFIFYYAGHGVPAKGDAWIAGVDASMSDEKTQVGLSTVKALLSALACRHKLVILDCCYSGSVFRDKDTFAHPAPALAPASNGSQRGAGTPELGDSLSYYLAQPAFVGMSAGRETPVVDGEGADQHSAFTAALLQTMRERADTLRADHAFTFRQLASAVEARVATSRGRQQIPDWGRIGDGRGDFVFQPTTLRATPREVAAEGARRELEKQILAHASMLVERAGAAGEGGDAVGKLLLVRRALSAASRPKAGEIITVEQGFPGLLGVKFEDAGREAERLSLIADARKIVGSCGEMWMPAWAWPPPRARAAVFGPDAKQVAFALEGDVVQVVTIDELGAPMRYLYVPQSNCNPLAMNALGTYLGTACGDHIRVMEVSTSKVVADWSAGCGRITAMCFLPNSRALVVGCDTGEVHEVNFGAKHPQRSVQSGEKDITCIGVASDGRTVAAGTVGRGIIVIDAATFTCTKVLKVQQSDISPVDGIRSVAFSRDGRQCVTGA